MKKKNLFSLLGVNLLGLEKGVAAGSGRGLGAEQVVPVTERRRKVADKVLVVVVVVVSTGPQGEKVAEGPGKVVARVRVNGLEQTQHDPNQNGDQVHVAEKVGPEQRAADSAQTSNSDLDRVGVLGGQAKGRGVAVVLLVNVLVQGANVQSAVEPVVPGILHEKEGGNLHAKGRQGRKVGRNVNVKKLANGLEGKDGHGLDKGVGHQDVAQALELLGVAGVLGILDLVLLKVGDAVQNVPWQAAAKVHKLVDHKKQEAGRQKVVVHPRVVVAPGLFDKRNNNVAWLNKRVVEGGRCALSC